MFIIKGQQIFSVAPSCMTATMTDEFRFYLVKKRHAENLILHAFRVFRSHGIEPVLIKGWAAARNYPESKPRFWGDVDLAVGDGDYTRALALVTGADAQAKGVDLHYELRALDTLPWETLFSNSELVQLDAEQVRILRAEDHLRVLCVHWLINGGEARERLWDIAYAVQNRPVDFDWSKCLDVVSTTRRKWIIYTIGLAHVYLGLKVDNLPFKAELVSLPSWLIGCVEKEWASGVMTAPLQTLFRSPRGFFQQLRKRIPPNPIQATVNCEGEFDDSPRLRYQVRDTFNRMLPSIRRVSGAIATGKMQR
jgi:hypothetical protein